MADVQIENGYTKMANEIFESIARIKLSPTQYRLLFVIWRYTYGFNRKEHDMSLKFLSQATGCDSRQIQRELKSMEERKVIIQDIKSGSYRKISFNKNHDEWIGKTAIGETTIGEIDNGETTKGRVGETVKGTIGEIDNQERKIKEISKEMMIDQKDKPNPFVEYERCFGYLPSNTFMHQINDWIDNSQFKEPEAIICETIKRVKLQTPKNPPGYIQSTLSNLHNLGLFTLAAVQEYNSKFDDKTKKQQSKRKSVHDLPMKRPDHWPEPEPLTEDEFRRMKELEAEMPY